MLGHETYIFRCGYARMAHKALKARGHSGYALLAIFKGAQ